MIMLQDNRARKEYRDVYIISIFISYAYKKKNINKQHLILVIINH